MRRADPFLAAEGQSPGFNIGGGDRCAFGAESVRAGGKRRGSPGSDGQ